MATTSRVTPWGWEQGDDSAVSSRVTPGGWEQVNAVAAASTAINAMPAGLSALSGVGLGSKANLPSGLSYMG